jgi:hypothetical protein
MDQLSGDWVKSYFKGQAELLAKAGDSDQSSSYQLAGEGTPSTSGSNSPSKPGGPPNMPGNPDPGPKTPGGPGPMESP